MRRVCPLGGRTPLFIVFVAAVCLYFGGPASGKPEEMRVPVLRPQRTASAYSVEVPFVARTAGSSALYYGRLPGLESVSGSSAFDAPTLVEPLPALRTSVDFVNNTAGNGVLVSYQLSYTCVAASCTPMGGFYRTTVQQITLPGLGGFHQDDFVQYLGSQGLLQPGAVQGALGTLLVTFSNLGSALGWEANVIANTYHRIVANDPLQGTVGFAYNASLFFDSADTTLIGLAQNTTASPTAAGSLRSDVAIRNTDIRNTNQNVTVDLSFYDTGTGQRVGNTITIADLKPGEVRLVTDVWTSAGIPPGVVAVIVFADARTPSTSSATMEGFVLVKDTQKSQSPRFVTMLCGDLNGCGF